MPKTRTTWTVNPAVKFALTPENRAQGAAAADETDAGSATDAATAAPDSGAVAPAPQAPADAAAAAERAAQQARMVHESYEALRSTLLSEQSKNDQRRTQVESELDATNLKIKENQSAIYDLERTPVTPPVAPPAPQPVPQAVPQSAPQPAGRAAAPLPAGTSAAPLPSAPNPYARGPQLQPERPAQTWQQHAAHTAPQPQRRGAAPYPTAPQQPVAPQSPAVAQAPVATPCPQWSIQKRPLRPDEGDLYVMPDGAISYLDNMLAFFQRKGLRVMYYNPGYCYRPSDIILLPYAPHPLPSTCTLVLDNNKRRTWDFLKLVFAARGITL
ncbi:MAG TPA: hypothetical protein H9898_08505 [Candidatus Anaerobiospirillum stercoravium]|nr:hypothetical protein [Candidatus Anaerobiospirillum stercoravium]